MKKNTFDFETYTMVFCFILLVAWLFWVWNEEQDCREKGGRLVKAAFFGFECVSYKELIK